MKEELNLPCPYKVFKDVESFVYSFTTKYSIEYAIIFNETPDFLNPSENKLQIGLESAAFQLGNSASAQAVPFDLLGVNRPNNPDAGAYQAIEFVDED